MMDQDSFSITLQSNLETENFANNTNFRFSNSVPPHINLQHYRVGLQSIYWTDYYERDESKPVVIPTVPKKPFFNSPLEDDVITLQHSVPKSLQPTKRETTFDQFIVAFNSELAKFNYKLHVSTIVRGGQIIGTKIMNTSDSVYLSHMDESLAKVLGFTQLEISHGENQSDKFSLVNFAAVASNAVVGKISQQHITQHELKLPQFTGKPLLSDLCNEIVAAVEEKDHKFALSKVPDHDALSFDLDGVNYRLILSEFLYDYLGIPRSFAFTGRGTVLIKKGLENPYEIDDFVFEPPKLSSSKLFVCCDLVEANYFAGKPLHYLAILDRRSSQNTESSYTPDKILYKKVIPNNPRHIQLSIQSDNNNFISPSDHPTFATLHFTKSRLE